MNSNRKDKYVGKFKTGLDIIFLIINISLKIIDYWKENYTVLRVYNICKVSMYGKDSKKLWRRNGNILS